MAFKLTLQWKATYPEHVLTSTLGQYSLESKHVSSAFDSVQAISVLVSLTGLSAGSAPCFAGNFIVDFSSNQTNGGFMIDGDDSLTITPSGSISVALGASAGIVSTVGYNVITNYGAVQIKGQDIHGIWNNVSPYSQIKNKGSILTEQEDAVGIWNYFSENSSIYNDGFISTFSQNGYGVYNFQSFGSIIENNGVIQSAGNFSYGILNYQSRDSPIANNGLIQTQGESALGIWNYSSNYSPIINSGAIIINSVADGIRNDNSNYSPIFNGGFISTIGLNGHGITNLNSENSAVHNFGSIRPLGSRLLASTIFSLMDLR